jgi:hypothetical protein
VFPSPRRLAMVAATNGKQGSATLRLPGVVARSMENPVQEYAGNPIPFRLRFKRVVGTGLRSPSFCLDDDPKTPSPSQHRGKDSILSGERPKRAPLTRSSVLNAIEKRKAEAANSASSGGFQRQEDSSGRADLGKRRRLHSKQRCPENQLRCCYGTCSAFGTSKESSRPPVGPVCDIHGKE